jgi:hypothetical protein
LGHAAEREPALHNGKSGIRSRRKPLRDNDVSEFHDRPSSRQSLHSETVFNIVI